MIELVSKAFINKHELYHLVGYLCPLPIEPLIFLVVSLVRSGSTLRRGQERRGL